jgi:hypothetical protein
MEEWERYHPQNKCNCNKLPKYGVQKIQTLHVKSITVNLVLKEHIKPTATTTGTAMAKAMVTATMMVTATEAATATAMETMMATVMAMVMAMTTQQR